MQNPAHSRGEFREDIDYGPSQTQLSEGDKSNIIDFELGKEQLKVRKLLTNTAKLLSFEETDRLHKRIENSRSKEEAITVGQEIANIQWQLRLKGKEYLFAEDENRGTTYKKHQEKFLQLSLDKQIQILGDLDTMIGKYQSQFDELKEIFSQQKNIPEKINNEFKKFGRRGRQKILDELAKTETTFQNIKKLTSFKQLSLEEQHYQEELFNNLGLNERQSFLDTIKNTLEKASPLDKDFDILAKIIRDNPEINADIDVIHFLNLSSVDKQKTINQLQQQITNYIRDSYNDVRAIMPKKDQESLDIWLNKTPISDLPFWVKNIDKNINEINEIAEAKSEFEEAVAETNGFKPGSIELQEYCQKIYTHFDLDNKFAFEIAKLFSNNKLQNYLEQVSTAENITEDNTYEQALAKLTKKDSNGLNLITDEAYNEYRDWFRDLPIATKKIINGPDQIKKAKADFLWSTIDARKSNNEKFLKLNKATQTSLKSEYLNSGFEERTILLEQTQIKQLKLSKAYSQKVDDLIAENLVSPDSKEPYLKWFNALTPEDMEVYLEASDLDNPKRAQILSAWDKVLNFVPDHKRKSLNKDFQKANLKKREQLLLKIGEEYYNDENAKRDINNELETPDLEPKIDQAQINFLQNKAETAEAEGDFDRAADFLTSIIELYNAAEIDNAKLRKYQKNLKELKELIGAKPEHQETNNPLEQEINAEIQNVISSPKNKSARTFFSMLFMAYRTTQNANRRAGGNFRATERIEAYHGDEQPDLDPDEALPIEFNLRDLRKQEKNKEKHPTHFQNRFYEAQSNPNPQDQTIANLKLVNAKGRELKADEFYDTEVEPSFHGLKNKLMEQVIRNLMPNFSDSPGQQARLKKLTEQAFSKIKPQDLLIEFRKINPEDQIQKAA